MSAWDRSTKAASAARSPSRAARARRLRGSTRRSCPTGTPEAARRTKAVMDCTTCRELLSAVLDGETTAAERAATDQHLAGCRACRAWSDAASRVHRLVRLRPAETVPDLAPAILAKAHPPNAGRWEWIRTALAVVALTELVLSVPALFGVDAGASVHV